ISKSIALVQYSRISNAPDTEYSRRITIDFIKFTGIFTALTTSVLLLLPPAFFELVFRSGFSRTGDVVLSLAPGIVAVAVSLMFSHYFSGSGKPWHNTISSAIGLAFTVVLGFSLIPAYGLTGAGITASAAYLAGTIYQMVAFSRLTNTRLREYIPGRRDAGRIKSMALSIIREKQF
ncbi:MAG TPA: polysaccharide biosynthesis C-terminal domain-containing protein, partial [Lentimicrobium sp.]|nr:polysaccharide biosynthesis C-terminal domain-containing protein [Lentimicrobium sp.]